MYIKGLSGLEFSYLVCVIPRKWKCRAGKGRVNISNNYVAPSDGWVRLQVNGTGNGSYIQLLSNDGYANIGYWLFEWQCCQWYAPTPQRRYIYLCFRECTLSAAQFYPC